jgi:hypothetical protein
MTPGHQGIVWPVLDTLFCKLSTTHPVLPIFTTNYDPAIEEFVERSSEYILEDGFFLVASAMWTQKPITVEVLAYAPVVFFHCLHCEVVWQEVGANQVYQREQLAASLPEDLKQQYQELSDWVRRMVAAHGVELHFKVVDAASIEGWYKSLRYGVRQYPAIIVDGIEKSIGSDLARATQLIESRLASPERGRR